MRSQCGSFLGCARRRGLGCAHRGGGARGSSTRDLQESFLQAWSLDAEVTEGVALLLQPGEYGCHGAARVLRQEQGVAVMARVRRGERERPCPVEEGAL